MTFSICTLGCRVNQYESRVIAEKLTELGYIENDFSSVCDIYIINSCAVTAESVRKSRQMIRRAKKLNPTCKIIVTGCFAQISPDESVLSEIADCVIGNDNKISQVVSAVTSDRPFISAESLENAEYEDQTLTQPKRAREYIKIQDGCEGKCAYCVIPRARGPIRSKPRESVLNEVQALAACGVKEIILTGIEIASYQYGLAELIIDIDKIDGIERISLGSLEPTLITENFADILSSSKKLTPHFHISVQSGCTTVLNRMRRKYNVKMLERSIAILRKRFDNLQLTCDIIVGFPGESDDEFNETYSFLKRNRFLHAHIFPYSIRPETEAATMPDQVPDDIKLERCGKLFTLQNQIKSELMQLEIETRKRIPVLFESFKDGYNVGHSDNYIEYKLKSDTDMTGKIIEVAPITIEKDQIIAN